MGSVGKRSGIEHCSGFWINDSNGNERGGYITTGDDRRLTLAYAASDRFHLTAGIDRGSLLLWAPGSRPRALLVTEGDRPAKPLFSAQGEANMFRVDAQTTKRWPPAPSDKEFFDALWITNP